jgi:hypothetical protein
MPTVNPLRINGLDSCGLLGVVSCVSGMTREPRLIGSHTRTLVRPRLSAENTSAYRQRVSGNS